MGSTAIIAAIDKELARLHEIRTKLLKQAVKSASSGQRKKAKSHLSPAGRARIAEAQRNRWAATRKKRTA